MIDNCEHCHTAPIYHSPEPATELLKSLPKLCFRCYTQLLGINYHTYNLAKIMDIEEVTETLLDAIADLPEPTCYELASLLEKVHPTKAKKPELKRIK